MTDERIDVDEVDELLDSLWAKYRPGERERCRADFKAFLLALPAGTSQAVAFRAYEEHLRIHPDALPRRRTWWDSFCRRAT